MNPTRQKREISAKFNSTMDDNTFQELKDMKTCQSPGSVSGLQGNSSKIIQTSHLIAFTYPSLPQSNQDQFNLCPI